MERSSVRPGRVSAALVGSVLFLLLVCLPTAQANRFRQQQAAAAMQRQQYLWQQQQQQRIWQQQMAQQMQWRQQQQRLWQQQQARQQQMAQSRAAAQRQMEQARLAQQRLAQQRMAEQLAAQRRAEAEIELRKISLDPNGKNSGKAFVLNGNKVPQKKQPVVNQAPPVLLPNPNVNQVKRQTTGFTNPGREAKRFTKAASSSTTQTAVYDPLTKALVGSMEQKVATITQPRNSSKQLMQVTTQKTVIGDQVVEQNLVQLFNRKHPNRPPLVIPVPGQLDAGDTAAAAQAQNIPTRFIKRINKYETQALAIDGFQPLGAPLPLLPKP